MSTYMYPELSFLLTSTFKEELLARLQAAPIGTEERELLQEEWSDLIDLLYEIQGF